MKDSLRDHPFRCKHCHIPVVGRRDNGKLNFKAIIGYQHGKHCPRRNQ